MVVALVVLEAVVVGAGLGVAGACGVAANVVAVAAVCAGEPAAVDGSGTPIALSDVPRLGVSTGALGVTVPSTGAAVTEAVEPTELAGAPARVTGASDAGAASVAPATIALVCVGTATFATGAFVAGATGAVAEFAAGSSMLELIGATDVDPVAIAPVAAGGTGAPAGAFAAGATAVVPMIDELAAVGPVIDEPVVFGMVVGAETAGVVLTGAASPMTFATSAEKGTALVATGESWLALFFWPSAGAVRAVFSRSEKLKPPGCGEPPKGGELAPDDPPGAVTPGGWLAADAPLAWGVGLLLGALLREVDAALGAEALTGLMRPLSGGSC